MKSSNIIEATSKGESLVPDFHAQRNEHSVALETPVKRQTLSLSNFYSSLSPLPLPPKTENSCLQPFAGYSRELIIVETPVAKESSKLPIHEDEVMVCPGIVNRIIFESSDEDEHNNSSQADNQDSSIESLGSMRQSSVIQENFSSQQDVPQAAEQESAQVRKEMGTEARKRSANKLRGGNASLKQSIPGKKVFCNCKKTKCLKLYCDCFRLNQVCDGCNCVGCHNLETYSEERSNAILALMDRNPDPFGQKIEDDRHVKGCNCKKSNCLKKYCECYQAGLRCGQNCKCEQCKNMTPTQKVELSKSTAKKQRKMIEI